jgi:hypothetical protein
MGRIEGKNADMKEDKIADSVIMIEDLIAIKEDYPDNGKIKAFIINIFKDGDNKLSNTSWVHDRFPRDESPSVIILIGIIKKGSK